MSFNHIAYVRSGQPDLTHRQMAILIIAKRDGQSTIRALASELDIPKPSVTRACNSLGRMGFIRRVRDATDRRSVFIVPTRTTSRFLAEVM